MVVRHSMMLVGLHVGLQRILAVRRLEKRVGPAVKSNVSVIAAVTFRRAPRPDQTFPHPVLVSLGEENFALRAVGRHTGKRVQRASVGGEPTLY